MNSALVILATSVLSGSLSAQESPRTPKAVPVRIIRGPKIELAKEHLTIINWTTNNPGGSPVHYGIVHYGTDPHSLIETAKSPIRLNPDHSSTVFRVRLDNLGDSSRKGNLRTLRPLEPPGSVSRLGGRLEGAIES